MLFFYFLPALCKRRLIIIAHDTDRVFVGAELFAPILHFFGARDVHGQIAATVKGAIGNNLHAIGNIYVRKASAAEKRMVFNLFGAIVNGHSLEVSATVKGAIANVGNALGDRNISEAMAMDKRVIS